MDQYLEIRLLPDPEFVPSVLMNALFAKLHRALVEGGSNRVGVSFPDHCADPPSLGERLRLHGSGDDLRRLMDLNWLTGMRDHINLDGPRTVPEQVEHRVVRRVQAKSNPERLRRRLIKRKELDAEAALRAIPDTVAQCLRLPYISTNSQSTGKNFRLFIEHSPPVPEPVPGPFSHYGLGSATTIPWF